MAPEIYQNFKRGQHTFPYSHGTDAYAAGGTVLSLLLGIEVALENKERMLRQHEFDKEFREGAVFVAETPYNFTGLEERFSIVRAFGSQNPEERPEPQAGVTFFQACLSSLSAAPVAMPSPETERIPEEEDRIILQPETKKTPEEEDRILLQPETKKTPEEKDRIVLQPETKKTPEEEDRFVLRGAIINLIELLERKIASLEGAARGVQPSDKRVAFLQRILGASESTDQLSLYMIQAHLDSEFYIKQYALQLIDNLIGEQINPKLAVLKEAESTSKRFTEAAKDVFRAAIFPRLNGSKDTIKDWRFCSSYGTLQRVLDGLNECCNVLSETGAPEKT